MRLNFYGVVAQRGGAAFQWNARKLSEIASSKGNPCPRGAVLTFGVVEGKMLLRSGRNASETAFSGAPRREDYHYPVVAFPPGNDGKHIPSSVLPVVKPFLSRFPNRLALL